VIILDIYDTMRAVAKYKKGIKISANNMVNPIGLYNKIYRRSVNIV